MKSKKLFYFTIVATIAIMMAFILALPTFAKAATNDTTKESVPFSQVEVTDGFMRNYMKLVICEVIPAAIENVERYDTEKGECGGMYNIRKCAEWHNGGSIPSQRPKPLGAKYVDSDVHKVLESMCMALDTPAQGDADILAAQEYISGVLEEWVPIYVKAQEPEKTGVQYPGYFDTFYSLTPTTAEDPEHGYDKYTNVDNHELYCQGHFMEAAVAHYRYTKHATGTGDTRLLDVAVKSANHIVKTFGDGANQRRQIPGHQEIELALMKLAKLCQEIGGDYDDNADAYIDKAAYFLELRGNTEGRTADIRDDQRQYYQDFAPVSQQTVALGHAVRAQYMYTGMCELASIKPEFAAKYNNALTALWENVTHQKQYVTGGIGDQSNNNEGFADEYFLPNYGSYCETCAGVANMLWNRSMSTLYDGAKYADQIETDLYNNVLGCINFDGDKFYYENRLCTTKGFDRSTWFGTACCPPNFTRTILQVGGYVYNKTASDIYVNQYVSNNANFEVNGNLVNSKMESSFPYTTSGKLTITPTTSANFNVQLRKPSWASSYVIKIDGQAYTPQESGDGYLIINRTWANSGTTIEFDFDSPLQYVKTDPRVESSVGLVALRKGPLFYCAEGIDNDANFAYDKAYIVEGGTNQFTYVDNLDGDNNKYHVRSVYVLDHAGKLFDAWGGNDVTWRLVPYYARCNRERLGMHVFLHDNSIPQKTHQKAAPYASFTSTTAYDSLGGLNDGSNEEFVRWTSWDNSNVQPNPWVEYDFDEPVCFNGIRVWWYDDNGGVRLPDSFHLTLFNKASEETEEIEVAETPVDNGGTEKGFRTYMFPEKYQADIIRMTMKNEASNHAVGIVEWELVDATPDPVNPDPGTNPEDIYGASQTGDNVWIFLLAAALLAAIATTGIILKRKGIF